ncbi:protein-disulfide isomerase [Terriglobus roseus DSM 18391]|uniref:Protein-disulfide isomerase n=1 Tax=Terriglobus roseus (strain DSM 18391 / NRRL B-41598 / KBS 63) TaxID=926566 RepID=I3ZIP9_TERRK|nr:thioredoxin domain-containing protein [Terriglobus roseus]AFL89117.1 protein-disulfide isomerase [Terriglobus roseus DSM 18391]
MSKLKLAVTSNDHRKGAVDAPCCLVEYGDYQCRSCGAAQLMLRDLQMHFGERLAIVFRNFPLSQLHLQAEPAAETAEFAAVHGKFWKMHDLLFDHQEHLGDELFHDLSERLGLSDPELQIALDHRSFIERIEADLAGGIRSGVQGTPAFFINGVRFDGANDYDSMVKAIEQTLLHISPLT